MYVTVGELGAALGQFCTRGNDVTLFANNARAQAGAGNRAQAQRLLAQADKALANLCASDQDQKPVLQDFVERIRAIVNGPAQAAAADAAKRQEIANQYAAAGQAPPPSFALPAATTRIAEQPSVWGEIKASVSNVFAPAPLAAPPPSRSSQVVDPAQAAQGLEAQAASFDALSFPGAQQQAAMFRAQAAQIRQQYGLPPAPQPVRDVTPWQESAPAAPPAQPTSSATPSPSYQPPEYQPVASSPPPPAKPSFGGADFLNIFKSLTGAAAQVGTAAVDAKSQKDQAKIGGRYAATPGGPSQYYPPGQGTVSPGLSTPVIVAIGVGVTAVAGLGLYLALRSGGDDEDED